LFVTLSKSALTPIDSYVASSRRLLMAAGAAPGKTA
jgi:hypothetical protein